MGEPVSSETSGFILFIEWKFEVHIVKIQCIQHEHTHTHTRTHTQTHTQMHAQSDTHTHKLNIYVCALQMFVPISCCCFFCFFFLGGGLKKKKALSYILSSLSHELISVSVQNKSIAHSQICTTTTKVCVWEREREREIGTRVQCLSHTVYINTIQWRFHSFDMN